MVRVTDFARPKRTHDKDDPPRRPLPPQDSAYQSQKVSRNPRSEARRLKRKSIRESDKECFVCRQTGHLSQDCPHNVTTSESQTEGRICYRCGRIDHSLKECKKPPIRKRNREESVSASEDETRAELEFLPYANCYVCHKSGHLAGSCPQNDRGIYPNGGGCKLCGIPLITPINSGAKDHLKKQCPQKEDIERGAVIARKEGETTGADEDAYHELLRHENKRKRPFTSTSIKKRPKVVNF